MNGQARHTPPTSPAPTNTSSEAAPGTTTQSTLASPTASARGSSAAWALSAFVACVACALSLTALSACKNPKSQARIVAAIQYAPGDAQLIEPACLNTPRPDLCALKLLITQAHDKGAHIIVTPEYATEQPNPILAPSPGDTPATDKRWPKDGALRQMSELAARHGLYLAINLLTQVPSTNALQLIKETSGPKTHNTLILLGPQGQVLALHNKFELFSGERFTLSPGRRVNVVSTPLGKLGLLVCADLYGDMRMHHRLTQTEGAEIVLVSASWTAQGAPAWPAAFARDWGVFVASANTTKGPGKGGGIFSPKGKTLAKGQRPGITLAVLPSR